MPGQNATASTMRCPLIRYTTAQARISKGGIEAELQVKRAEGRRAADHELDGEVYDARQRATKHPSAQFRERT